MTGHPAPPAPPGSALDPDPLRPRLWVADVVCRPLETALLAEGRRRACRWLDGGGMAVFPAARSFEISTGRKPDPQRMLEHFAVLVRTEGAARAVDA